VLSRFVLFIGFVSVCTVFRREPQVRLAPANSQAPPRPCSLRKLITVV
jgi:hypothetical protein